MSDDVVAHGDERPRRGRALGVAVTLALLALVAVALRRDEPPRPAARPAPSLPPAPATDEPDLPPDPFATFVTVPRPPPGVLRTVLIDDDVPGFLAPGDDLPTALAAVGGPAHAPVVVGWCAATRAFQDAAGQVFYDEGGAAYDAGRSLARYLVRRNPDRSRIDVSADATVVTSPAPRPKPRPCRERLYYPTLPERVTRVHDTIRGHRVVRGRYVVTTESRAFCAPLSDRRCDAEGWEQYGAGLPPGDLAGSYTWEGEFVVRGATGGALTAIRLPGARLVRRERVGARVLAGFVTGVMGRGDAYALLFAAAPDADAPPGDLAADVAGPPREYPMRHDAELVLGPGFSGLGRDRATPLTLVTFLDTAPDAAKRRFFLVLDARGRVLRLVVEPRA